MEKFWENFLEKFSRNILEKKFMENEYKKYDEVINVVMTNILVERQRCGKYLIYDFQEDSDADRLYFNVTAVAADLNNEKIYLDMPLLSYLKFKKKRSKKRTNLRWFNWFQKKKLDDEFKTSPAVIMDFICEQLKLNYRLFKEINDEYYGWIE